MAPQKDLPCTFSCHKQSCVEIVPVFGFKRVSVGRVQPIEEAFQKEVCFEEYEHIYLLPRGGVHYGAQRNQNQSYDF